MIARRLAPALLACSLLLAGPLWAASTERDPELREHLRRAIVGNHHFQDHFDAQVWLLSQSNALAGFVADPGERIKLLQAVHSAAIEANLQPELVLAVIEVESRFNRFAISSAGAQGLMQVMPFWKDEIGRGSDRLTDVYTNLRYGCHILHYYLKRERGNLVPALARYNGSYGQTWYAERVLQAWQNRWLVGSL